jgi:hypothetical protein
MGKTCSTNGENRSSYRILVRKPEGMRPLGRLRRRSVVNVKMDLEWIEWGYLDCSILAENKDQWRDLVNAVMNLRVPSNAGKFLSGCTTGDLSSRAKLHGVS